MGRSFRLLRGLSVVAAFAAFAAVGCSAAPETDASSSDEQGLGFGGGGITWCQYPYHPYAGPYIYNTVPQCTAQEELWTTYRSFNTSAFETALKNHGCKYSNADVRKLYTDSSGNGWSITVCPDDCGTRQIVDQYHYVSPIWSDTDTSRPGDCIETLPSGKIFVIFEPLCPGGCPGQGI